MKIEFPIYGFVSNRVRSTPKKKTKIVGVERGKYVDDKGKTYKYICFNK